MSKRIYIWGGDSRLRKIYVYCGIMVCLIAVCLVVFVARPKLFLADDSLPDQTPEHRPLGTSVSDMESPGPNECFTKLAEERGENPDVYAWLYIPGTNIDYPMAQSKTSDTRYLTRNSRGEYSPAGSIMTEHIYNSATFEDPVTVVYGQCMKSGAMFGNLQEYYASAEGLKRYGTIEIFLPDRMLEYEVFAAVPYDKRHILYNYDFSQPRIFKAFFNSIATIRSFNAHVINEARPESDEKVLILSTRLHGDGQQRFLVMARLVRENII